MYLLYHLCPFWQLPGVGLTPLTPRSRAYMSTGLMKTMKAASQAGCCRAWRWQSLQSPGTEKGGCE